MKTSTIPGPLLPSPFQQQFFLGWTLELLQARWQPRWFFGFSSATSVRFYDSKPHMHFFKMLFCRDGVIPYIFSSKPHIKFHTNSLQVKISEETHLMRSFNVCVCVSLPRLFAK